MTRRLFLSVISLFAFICANAQWQFPFELQKGFKALEKNDYAKAFDIFDRLLKMDSTGVGAHYGLARIYFSKDYPGYDLDKAVSHINISETNFAVAGKKAIATLARLDIDQTTLDALKGKIDDELFSVAANQNSPAALEAFIRNYPDNPNREKAQTLLDQLNFFDAQTSSSTTALDNYIKNNPGSKDLKKAVSARNMLAFQRAKASNSIDSLRNFISRYPDADEMGDARIALATLEFQEAKKLNTIAAFDTFMTRYPEADEFKEATTMRNQLAYIQLLEEQKSTDAKEIQKKNADIKTQGQQLNLFIFGSLVLLIVAGFLYRGYLQKKKSNREITLQKEIIEQKNQEIVDSINYAKRIQDSMLPPLPDIRKRFPESFVFFRPRDIVSGDFYWFAENGDNAYIAAVDCTGHGVPGSLVSMMGFNFLNQLVNESDISDPGKILDQLHEKISLTLNKEMAGVDRGMRDGMDIALLCVNKKDRTIKFSGAVRPLIYFDDDGIKTIRSGMYSIGGIKSLTEEPFVTHQIKTNGKATFYLFSDGYADQFGGDQGKKLKMKKMQELLQNVRDKNMDEQHREIERAFLNWMGKLDQVDDVCVVGLRI